MSAKVTKVLRSQRERKCGKCGAEIGLGDPYIFWAFRYGGKRVRCSSRDCYPRPSELVSSPFISGVMRAEEMVADAIVAFEAGGSVEDLQGDIEGAASEIRGLGDEARDSFENMPEGLQQGDTGLLLERRAESCEEIADALEGLDLSEVFLEALSGLEPDLNPAESPEDREAVMTALSIEAKEGEDEGDLVEVVVEAYDQGPQRRPGRRHPGGR